MSYLKKIVALIAAVLCVTIAGITGTEAASDGNTQYLSQIAKSTAAILTKVNDLPNYLAGMEKIIEMSVSWLKTDDSDTTANLQSQFATLGKSLGDPNASIDATNQKILMALFNVNQQSKITFNTISNINNYTYPSFLGTPLAPNASGSSTAFVDYIMNASGISLPHPQPSKSWRGDATSIVLYHSLYQAVNAIETFNSNVLTELHYRNGKDFTTAQEALISQASSSNFIQEVATEDLGKVLRQLLMFEAQQYVLSTEQIKLQKQALMAAVMTNTMLILNNQKNEFELAQKAQSSNAP